MAQSAYAPTIVNRGITRSIFRWIHIIFSIPILGYIYSPFEKLPDYAPATRFVFLPVMVLSGLWDVERRCPSTTYFEDIGLTRRCSEPGTARPFLGGRCPFRQPGSRRLRRFTALVLRDTLSALMGLSCMQVYFKLPTGTSMESRTQWQSYLRFRLRLRNSLHSIRRPWPVRGNEAHLR